MTKVINIFGGPGSGKSTLAAGLFYKMKEQGFNVELVTEYAKELVYNETLHTTSQQEIMDVQYARLETFFHEDVDFVVTDAPVAISLIYGKEELTMEQQRIIFSILNGIKAFNYILPSGRFKYEPKGRVQSKTEAVSVELDILNMFDDSPWLSRRFTLHNTTDQIISQIITDIKAWD